MARTQAVLALFAYVLSTADAGNITCERPIDIMFLADGSGSVTSDGWDTMMEFLGEFAAEFEWGPLGADMGLITFAGTASLVLPLDTAASARAFALDASSIPFPDLRNTNIAAAIRLATDHFIEKGRPSSTGAAWVTIVLTDGESTVPGTVAAANEARQAGVTVAVVSLGIDTLSDEISGMVGGDLSLWFPVENWIRTDNMAVVNNLTASVCGRPATINDTNTAVNAQLACNTTQVFRYSKVASPVTLTANITFGAIVLCYSYVSELPLPTVLLPAGAVVPNTTRCSDLSLGTFDVATATAFPFNGTDGGKPLLQGLDLFVSVTALPDPRTGVCGGNFTLRTTSCSVRLALNASVVGTRADLINPNTPLNITFVGDASQPQCSACPQGTAYLGTSGPLATVCAPQCLGSAQFFGSVAGQDTCVDCDASCSACSAPGTARACTTCDAPSSLLLNVADPAFTSPFWSAQDALVANASSGRVTSARSDAALRAALLPPRGVPAGRCVASCPSAPPSQPRCDLPAQTWASSSRASLLSVCLPVPSTFASCDTWVASLDNAIAAFALSQALQVPAAAVFVRGCLDLRVNLRNVYVYNSSSLNAAATIAAPSDQIASELAAYGTCCAAVITYAVDLGAAVPIIGSTAQTLALSLTPLVLDPAALNARHTALEQSVASAVDAGRITPSCAASAAAGGVPVFIGACAENSTMTSSLTTDDTWSLRDVLTMCVKAAPATSPSSLPSPMPSPSVSATVGSSASEQPAPILPSITVVVTPSTSPAPAAANVPPSPALSPGATAGISVLFALLALIAIVAFALWQWRRRTAAQDARKGVDSFTIADAYDAATQPQVVVPVQQPTPSKPVVTDNPMRNARRVGGDKVAFERAQARVDGDANGSRSEQGAKASAAGVSRLVPSSSDNMPTETGPQRRLSVADRETRARMLSARPSERALLEPYLDRGAV